MRKIKNGSKAYVTGNVVIRQKDGAGEIAERTQSKSNLRAEQFLPLRHRKRETDFYSDD